MSNKLELINKIENHINSVRNEPFYTELIGKINEDCEIILHYHHAGFWSIFNKLMNYLLYFKNIKKISFNVIPIESNFYGKDELFSPLFKIYNENSNNQSLLKINAKHYITYELTGYYGNLLHVKNTNWRTQYNQLWNKYIKLTDDIETEFNSIKEQIMNLKHTYKVISISIRHPKIAHEQIYGVMPTLAQYDIEILKLLEKYDNNCVLILATDVYEYEKYFRERYSHITIIHPFSVKAGEYQNEAHNTNYDGNKEIARATLLTVLILSLGDHYIHHNSNMATAALYINPEMESHFLFRK